MPARYHPLHRPSAFSWVEDLQIRGFYHLCVVQYRKKTMSELDRLSPGEYEVVEKLPVSFLLDNIRSANNVGSIFRTADCFALQHIYLCGITARPPHRDILKTALGSTTTVNWSYHEHGLDLAQELMRAGSRVYCLEQTENSQSLQALNLNAQLPLVIVLGNEVQGVQQEIIDASHGTIEIEQYGTKHSLNVAVCGGVMAWEVSRRLRWN